MILLKNVNKKYNSDGITNIALKDINLEFGKTGFISILGKSGSGKSTLLNIIGGLDQCDSGVITVGNKSTELFLSREWDSYRNTHVGFVFQEFYLLEELTVKENILIALELQGIKEHEQKVKSLKEVLELVEMSGLENRKPSELSSGQKQRVAIARALIKKPTIILADEPSGSLDSETGENILKILKKISQNNLVIVVTHDIYFANKYADRIIELKDGELIKDTKEVSVNNTNNEIVFIKAKLPLKYILTFGVKDILNQKIRLLFISILFTLSLIFIGLASNLTFYDIEKVTLKTFEKANIDDIPIKKYGLECFTDDDCHEIKVSFNEDDYKSLSDHYDSIKFLRYYNGTLRLFNNIDEDGYYTSYIYKVTIIDENEDLIHLQLGKMPQQENEVLITDYLAEIALLELNLEKLDELIGKDISTSNQTITITGIVGTDYRKYDQIRDDMSELSKADFLYDLENNYAQIYTTQEIYMNTLEGSKGFFNFSLKANESNYLFFISKVDQVFTPYLLGNSKLPSGDYEILLHQRNLSSFFDLNEDVIDINDYLGKKITTYYYMYDEGYYRPKAIVYTIVGIFDYDNGVDEVVDFVLDDQQYHELILNEASRPNLNFVALLGDDQSENLHFIDELYEINAKHDTLYSHKLYVIGDVAHRLKTSLYITGTIIALFTTILISTFISIRIIDKEKVIGILRALGSTARNISMIFICEGLILLIFSSTIANISTYFLIDLINKLFTSNWDVIILMYFDAKTVMVILSISVLITILSVTIPIKKILRNSPIESIKHI